MPKVIVVLLGMISICTAEFCWGQLLSGGDWKAAKEIADSSYVMTETGEQVLMYRSNILAGAMLGVFRVEQDVATKSIVDMLLRDPGISVTTAIPNSSLIGISTSMLSYDKSEYVRILNTHNLATAIESLVRDGFGVDAFKETRVFANKFNQLGRRNASSTYAAHIIDAEKLLGIHGTVVILYRTDREKRWGWSSVHDPFSFGHHSVETRVVDKRLFNIMSSVGSKAGGAYYLGPLGQKPPHDYLDEWRQARNWLRRK